MVVSKAVDRLLYRNIIRFTMRLLADVLDSMRVRVLGLVVSVKTTPAAIEVKISPRGRHR